MPPASLHAACLPCVMHATAHHGPCTRMSSSRTCGITSSCAFKVMHHILARRDGDHTRASFSSVLPASPHTRRDACYSIFHVLDDGRVQEQMHCSIHASSKFGCRCFNNALHCCWDQCRTFPRSSRGTSMCADPSVLAPLSSRHRSAIDQHEALLLHGTTPRFLTCLRGEMEPAEECSRTSTRIHLDQILNTPNHG